VIFADHFEDTPQSTEDAALGPAAHAVEAMQAAANIVEHLLLADCLQLSYQLILRTRFYLAEKSILYSDGVHDLIALNWRAKWAPSV
jgi:hypothetical protein